MSYPAPYDLSKRVAIVTGGGAGIGEFIADALASHGADIVLVGRRADVLAAKAAEIQAHTGRRCLALQADVTDPDAVEQMVADAFGAFGRIDILVNNAGGADQRPLRKVTAKAWQDAFALNVHSAFYCSNAARPHLEASGSGVIVNISSLAGIHGTIGAGPYSAAKAALQMLTQVASAEWGPLGIRVNCVAPGMTMTPRVETSWRAAGMDPLAACREFPLRRPGTPEEVSNAVVFLASDASSYITGETLAVGGGPQIKGMIDDS